MKQSLHLKLGHQLSMTPQLQQAIKLLQLSSLELQQEIQQALCTNPLLELADEIAPEETETAETEAPDTNTVDESWNQEIPEELPVDARWEDIYQTTAASGPQRELPDFESFHSVTESLRDHLYWQLNLTPMSDEDRLIATAVIDAVNDDGLLSLSVEELQQSCSGQDGQPFEREEILAVLHRVQQFDPPGVAAADLRARIDNYHRPYHAALRRMLDRAAGRFGGYYHINCHSMPAVATAMSAEPAGSARPDFVLGTRDGTTTGPALTDCVRAYLSGRGYDVRVDHWYKGVEIVRLAGDPARGRHSLQIEINRRLYMDEQKITKSAGYADTKTVISGLIDELGRFAAAHPPGPK